VGRLVAPLLALLLGFAAPQVAAAAIGAPAAINTLAVNVASGSAVTTNVDAPIGSLIIVEAVSSGSFDVSVTGCTLSDGDTLSQAVQSTPTASAVGVAIFYASNTAHDLASGASITCSSPGSAITVAAYKISGANGGLDKVNSAVNATPTTSASIATAAMAVNSELVFPSVITGGCLFGTWTEGSGFTTLTNASGSAFANAYEIVSSTTAPTYAPSYSGSCGYSAVIATFEATGSAAPHHFLMSMGVGS
jgi:hypothetical protein